MALYSSNGVMASKPPRTIQTLDSRSGCPGASASGPYGNRGSAGAAVTLISQTIVLTSSALLWIHARIIFNMQRRCDVYLSIDNVVQTPMSLNYAYYAGGNNWEEEIIIFTTTLAAGTHYIELRDAEYDSSICANRFGCGNDWGEINTLIWER